MRRLYRPATLKRQSHWNGVVENCDRVRRHVLKCVRARDDLVGRGRARVDPGIGAEADVRLRRVRVGPVVAVWALCPARRRAALAGMLEGRIIPMTRSASRDLARTGWAAHLTYYNTRCLCCAPN